MKEVPVPETVVVTLSVYQFNVAVGELAVAERETVPVPHREPLATVETVGPAETVMSKLGDKVQVPLVYV